MQHTTRRKSYLSVLCFINQWLNANTLENYQMYFNALTQNGVDEEVLAEFPGITGQVCALSSEYGGAYNADIPGIVETCAVELLGTGIPEDALIQVHDMLGLFLRPFPDPSNC